VNGNGPADFLTGGDQRSLFLSLSIIVPMTIGRGALIPHFCATLALHGYSGFAADGLPPQDIAVISGRQDLGISVSEVTDSPVLRRTVGARRRRRPDRPAAAEAAAEFEVFAAFCWRRRHVSWC